MAGALVDSANVRGEISGRHPHRQSPQRSRRHGPQERIRPPGSVALATTGRSVCRSSFCGGERCCRCCCPPLPVFSCVGRLGTLAAAASPQTKPPAGVVAAHGCPPTPARTANPATPPRPSGDLGGRRWLLSVCWRRDASAGSPAGVFADPTPTAGSTQITYVAYISRVGMVLDHENKSDRLREGFDR
jgi:hypothetical protein